MSELAASDLYSSPVTLTGHSLGGGLAGYVAGIYGQKAYVFDSMPYELSVINDYIDAVNLDSMDTGVTLRSLLYNNSAINGPSFNLIKGFATEDEVVSWLRLSEETSTLPSHGSGLSALQLHSMALQVSLQWADLYTNDDWFSGAQYMWSAYFGDRVSTALAGELNKFIGGGGSLDSTLQEIIAYSAITDGHQPFGDTALAALFDDAADLSKAVNTSVINLALSESRQLLADISMEYSARLAVDGTLTSENVKVQDGVLRMSETSGSMIVDFSDATWRLGTEQHRSSFKDEILDSSLSVSGSLNDFRDGLVEYQVASAAPSADGPQSSSYNVVNAAYYQMSGTLNTTAPEPVPGHMSVLFLSDSVAGADTTAAASSTPRPIVGSVAGDNIIGHDEDNLFFGGSGSDVLRGGGGINVLYGGTDNDTIHSSGKDIISGGAGNDFLKITGESATVSWGSEDGNDTLEVSRDTALSIILKDASLNDLYFVMGGDQVDNIHYNWAWDPGYYFGSQFLVVKNKFTGASIAIKSEAINVGDAVDSNIFYYTDLTPKQYAIDNIVFPTLKLSDGTVMSSQDIADYVFTEYNSAVTFDTFNRGLSIAPVFGFQASFSRVNSFLTNANEQYFQASPLSITTPLSSSITGTADRDVISATDGSDNVIAGGGDDYILESEGDDTYVWNPGDGNDIIEGYFADDGFNVLRLGAGVSQDNLVFTAVDSTSLKIHSPGIAGSVILRDILVSQDNQGIDQIQFADGTIWSKAELLAEAEPVILAARQIISGTESEDTVHGPQNNFETMLGAGNDNVILSGDGRGTIVFARGDGNDTLYSDLSKRGETLRLSDVLPGDVVLRRTDNALRVEINGSSSSFTAIDQFEHHDGQFGSGISFIAFADGTTWNRSLIHSNIVTSSVTGDWANNILSGYDGADVIAGAGGDDDIRGGTGNDHLEGGSGDDRLFEEAGDDTYVWNTGDGDDRVNITEAAGFNILAFAFPINPGDVSVSFGGPNMADILFSVGTSGSIRIIDQRYATNGINAVTFANGTTWNRSAIDAAALGPNSGGGTEGNDVLEGSHLADQLSGRGGDDTLRGNGGSDTLDGGIGNDHLEGGDGDDIYLYAVGGGIDSISDHANIGSSRDTLVLGNGITPSDLRFAPAADAADLVISFSGSAGSITIEHQLGGSSAWGIDTLRFSDGREWSADQLNATYYASRMTADNDTIIGSWRADLLQGGGGDDVLQGRGENDTLEGGAGNDIIRYSQADTGFDIVDGGAGTDRIEATANDTVIGVKSVVGVETVTAGSFTGVTIAGSADADVLNFAGVTLTGITRIDAGAGSDTVTGSSAPDIIVGGAGNDVLAGGAGNDIFSYSGSDNGFDTVDGGSGQNIIRAESANTVIGLRSLIAGIITANGFANVSIQGSSENDTLSFAAVTLTGIARIDAGDGTDTVTGSGAADTIYGAAGADTISGGNGNDMIDGGAGNDVLTGGGNDDVIKGGDGDDTVNVCKRRLRCYRRRSGDGQGSGYGSQHRHRPQLADRCRVDHGRNVLWHFDRRVWNGKHPRF